MLRTFNTLGAGGSFRRLGAAGGGGLASRVMSYLSTLSPTLLLKFNETSGNVINYGSDGGAGTVSGCTQAQVGQLGASEAYLYDGVDDIVTFTNASLPTTKALTTQRWCYLIKPTNYGEGGYGKVAWWSSVYTLSMAVNTMFARVSLSTTPAESVPNVGQVDFIGSWVLLFVDYDDGNALGLGRRLRIIRATLASEATLLTLSTNTAGVGTVVTPVEDFIVGNRGTLDLTFNGLFDFAFISAGLWSPSATPADLSVPNYIRSMVFGV